MKIFEKGFNLAEVMVATAIVLLIVVALVAAMNTYARLSRNSPESVKATYLAEEGIEVIKYFRDASWTSNIATLPLNTTLYLNLNGSTWSTTTTYALIDNKYDRRITISNALRDGASNIVDSGGTADTNTKKVTVTVAWSDGRATTTETMSTYIANIFNN